MEHKLKGSCYKFPPAARRPSRGPGEDDSEGGGGNKGMEMVIRMTMAMPWPYLVMNESAEHETAAGSAGV